MTAIKFSSADLYRDRAGVHLDLLVDNPGLAETFLSTWDPTKKYVAEVKEYRERRSLDANAYFHVLVGKIAEVMNLGFEEVKTNLVVEYGAVARDADGFKVGFKLPESVDVSQIYRYVKLFDTRVENGKTFNCYIVFKHTHTLDSKEMSRLIDGAIYEAKNLGIETATPQELSRMKEEWNR